MNLEQIETDFDYITDALLYEGDADTVEKLIDKLEDLLTVAKRHKRKLDRRDC